MKLFTKRQWLCHPLGKLLTTAAAHGALLTAVGWVAGCAQVYRGPDPTTIAARLSEETLHTEQYQHRIYADKLLDTKFGAIERLYIYIEGDGTPWLGGMRISPDPTPRKLLALDLMLRAHHPAVYVGRPCHFLVAVDPNCLPDAWTFGRYSETVVASMRAAIAAAAARHDAAELVLVGYSGGGTLAALVAESLPRVTGLITIGANLDIELWTNIRKFEHLTNSLNPSARAPLSADIVQIHLIGALDTVVPPRVTTAYSHRIPQSTWIYSHYDHACCWARDWPKILARVERALDPARVPQRDAGAANSSGGRSPPVD